MWFFLPDCTFKGNTFFLQYVLYIAFNVYIVTESAPHITMQKISSPQCDQGKYNIYNIKFVRIQLLCLLFL